MTEAETLLAALHGDRVDTDEFINELVGYFGLARTDDDTVTFPGEGQIALQAVFDGEGVLDRLVPGPAFDATVQAALEERIRTRLVEDVGTALHAHTLFASRAVSGHYRHPGGSMQILPVPAHAPRPLMLIGEHPFRIEIMERASTDWHITQIRALKATRQWAWVLNLLLRGRVTDPSESLPRHWILWPEEVNGGPIEERVHFAQEYYSYTGANRIPNEFSPLVGRALERVPADRYFDRRRIVADTLDLPDYIDDAIDAFMGAPAPLRDRLLRSLHWFYAADQLWSIHRGSMCVALVSALEVLAYKPIGPHICPTCSKDHYPGATAGFREFIEDLAPSADRKAINRLYRLRSSLVHGTVGLLADRPWNTSSTPSYWTEMDVLEELRALTRSVVVAWLLRLAPPSAESKSS